MLFHHLAYRLLMLGLPGIAGLALMIAAIGIVVVLLMPTQASIDRLDNKISVVAARLKNDGDSSNDRLMTKSEQIEDFYRIFPKREDFAKCLSKAYAIAEEQKIVLEQGEYSSVHAETMKLNQFRITFPIRGSYQQIRKFVGNTLAALPTLALEGLELKRNNIGESIVMARVTFLLYLEKGE